MKLYKIKSELYEFFAVASSTDGALRLWENHVACYVLYDNESDTAPRSVEIIADENADAPYTALAVEHLVQCNIPAE